MGEVPESYDAIAANVRDRDAIIAVGNTLYHADSVTRTVTIIRPSEYFSDPGYFSVTGYEEILAKCSVDYQRAGNDVDIRSLITQKPLSPRVQAEFDNLMNKIAIINYEYAFGFRIPLAVRADILAQARTGITAVQNGEPFVITVDSPYKEYIENEIAKINYAGQLSRLEDEIAYIEDADLKPQEIAALGQLKASIDGYGSYFTVSRQDRTEALKLAQRLANGNLVESDLALIQNSPYKAQILQVFYATALDKFNTAAETLTAVPDVITAFQNMKSKTEWALLSSLTIEQRGQGLIVLTALAEGKRTSEIEAYNGLPPSLKLKADRIEYEIDKAKFNELLVDPGVPASVKLAVAQLAARADNTFSSFRLHIAQRGFGFMAGSLLMEAAKTNADPKAQLDIIFAKANELLADTENYGIYKEEIDQVVIFMASDQIDNALRANKQMTPETLRLIKELQEHSKDTRIPLETRLAALKSARDYVANPTLANKALFEIGICQWSCHL